MFDFRVNKTFVHFIYDNGIIETENALVRESDKELRCGKRIIAKHTDHAKIDNKGRRHYFVHGHSVSTDTPFPELETTETTKENKPIEREAVFHIMQASLLKSLVQAQTMPIFTTLLLVLTGVGIGYVLGSEWGGETINNVQDTDNYYQDTDKDNGTIVLTNMNLDISPKFFMGVYSWKVT